METHPTPALSGRRALDLNLCEEERDLLIQAVKNEWSVGDLYDELRQAAFDHCYDGETEVKEWKEETWVTSYEDYLALLSAANESASLRCCMRRCRIGR